jgi:hypothetical protein
MDKLDELILKKKQEVGKLRLFLERPESLKEHYNKTVSELRSLELAASLRPGSKSESAKTGKPEGAISLKWRAVMREIVRTGNQYRSVDEIIKIARKSSFTPSDNATAYRFGRYEERGFVEKNKENEFRVSPKAIERFNLKEGQND